jgi:penicillin-binding protein 2
VIVCGKTGTTQNPHGEDHSIFIGFAPKDKPKIALAVYVENGGWGSTWAVPIGSLMIEKYINDTISRQYLEERIVNGEIEY